MMTWRSACSKLGAAAETARPDAFFSSAHGNIQLVASRQNHATLDEVFEFANVAWPIGVHQGIHGLLRDRSNPLLHFAGVVQHEIMYQERNVPSPFAQRRNFDREHIQFVKKVLTELVIADHARQIAVRGGNHANVHADGVRASQSFKFMFLQSSQQLGL
jgi:hypothetical protein